MLQRRALRLHENRIISLEVLNSRSYSIEYLFRLGDVVSRVYIGTREGYVQANTIFSLGDITSHHCR